MKWKLDSEMVLTRARAKSEGWFEELYSEDPRKHMKSEWEFENSDG